MSWRLAKSLDKLREQVDELYPGRSKRSDGTIGDAAHAATVSDHNPDSGEVVRALDLTHDPEHGLDARQLADQLVANRDPRIKYVISEGRIASSYPAHGYPAWSWRPYTGLNAHKTHVHVSVVEGKAGDSAKAWKLAKAAATSDPAPAQPLGPRPVPAPRFPLPRGWYFGPLSGPINSVSGFRHRLTTGRRGHRGLQAWQRRMIARGWDLGQTGADGLFGDDTARVVRAFQSDKGLVVDGKLGPATWAAAWESVVTA